MVHPLLVALFASWEAADARWCLLRGLGTLDDPTGDVDVLVDRRDVGDVVAATIGCGFVRWRSWCAAGQHSFVARDPTSGRWLSLHVTDRLAFGPRHGFELDTADDCVGRRRHVDGVWVAASDDELWITLLHALLDKGQLVEKHRRALVHLVNASGDGLAGPVPGALARCVPGCDLGVVLDAVRARRWDAVEASGAVLARQWSRRRDARVRAARNALALAAHKVREAVSMPGPCVALLGPDGAGKSTIAASLPAAFAVPTRVVYLGVHGAAGPALARRAPPGAAGAVRAAWLLVRRARVALLRARRWVVVLDRHPLDVMTGPPASTWRGRVRRVVLVGAAPTADAYVVLDAPAAVLHARKGEHDVASVDERRRRYLELAHRVRNAVVVDASAPIDVVRDEVVAALWERYRARIHPGSSDGRRLVDA